MEPPTILPFPHAPPDPIERDLTEIDAAIALVAVGSATRVHLVGLLRPERAAAVGLAHAQQANVAFSVDRDPQGRTTVVVGPRD